MSGVSLPVTRPVGRALIIGSGVCRAEPLETMQRLGFQCAELDDPYAAFAEICRRPLAYRAVIVSLNSLYREELPMVQAIKQRWPHVDVWMTHTDGRQAFLAEAMRLGADGLLSGDGLHRTAVTEPSAAEAPAADPLAEAVSSETMDGLPADPLAPAESGAAATPEQPSAPDPVLTAEELRALLDDDTLLPPVVRQG
jgi:DNA-binding NarL/FixJ family response regulator